MVFYFIQVLINQTNNNNPRIPSIPNRHFSSLEPSVGIVGGGGGIVGGSYFVWRNAQSASLRSLVAAESKAAEIKIIGLVRSVGWTPAGLAYVFAKGVSDQVRDPLTPRNSLQ